MQPPGVGTVDAHGDRYRANRAAVVALVAMAERLSLISSLSLYIYAYIYIFIVLSLSLSLLDYLSVCLSLSLTISPDLPLRLSLSLSLALPPTHSFFPSHSLILSLPLTHSLPLPLLDVDQSLPLPLPRDFPHSNSLNVSHLLAAQRAAFDGLHCLVQLIIARALEVYGHGHDLKYHILLSCPSI